MKQTVYFFLILSFLSFQCKKGTDIYSSPPESYNHDLNPGSSARDFLRSTSYQSLKIEIQYMPGFAPDADAIEIFVDFLRRRLNKPAGIFIEQKQINPTLKTSFSFSDISDIENRERTVYTSGDQLGAYILITDGSYYIGNTLALSYENTSMCLFGESYKDFTLGLTADTKAKIMAMLFEHEFGHLLGLVNMGTPMKIEHLDNEHSNHCNNSACLMHHTFESLTEDTRSAFISMDIPSLDANCIADLKLNGGN